MTPEQQAENIECLKANWRGEHEFEAFWGGAWHPTSNLSRCDTIPHRRKPKPALVPWDCKEDVPLNCWLRGEYESEGLVTLITPTGVFFGLGAHGDWDKLYRYYEYSTDRKTWLPCSKLKS